MGERPHFSTRQITGMVVAVCAAIVLAPVGVFAASHDKVEIADASHPSRTANVLPGGALSVHPTGTTKVSGTVGLPAPKPFADEAYEASVSATGVTFTMPAHPVEIQTVSVYADWSSAPGGVIGDIHYQRAGAGRDDYFAVTQTGTQFNAVSTEVSLYPDAGSKVTVAVADTNLVGGSATISVSGVEY